MTGTSTVEVAASGGAPADNPPAGRTSGAIGRRAGRLAAAAVAAGAIANLPALRGGFFSDDFGYVKDNAKLAAIPLSQAWRIFTGWTNPFEYLPVRDLSYRIDMALFGLAPAGFHAVNVLLYVLACGAAFLAMRSVLRLLRGVRGDEFELVAAAMGTAIFAVHPAHVEAVAWIASRKDILAGLFTFAAIWRFAEALSRERAAWRGVAGAAVLYALALLSKASALPLAPLAFLLAAARFAKDRLLPSALVRASAVAAPFLVLAAGSTLLAASFKAASPRVLTVLDIYGTPVATVPLAIRIIGAAVRTALVPSALTLHHGVRASGLEGVALVAAGAAAILAAGWGAWATVRGRSVAGFCFAAFALFLVPYTQIVPFAAWSEWCERWLFLPSLGLALGVGLLAAHLVERRRVTVAAVAAMALVGTGLGLTTRRSLEWGSVDRLVEVNLARASGHYGATGLALVSWAPSLRFADARAAAARVANPAYRERILLIADGWQALSEGRKGDARRVVARLATLVFVPLTVYAEADLALRAGDDFEAARIAKMAYEYEPAMALRVLREVRRRHAGELAALEEAVSRDPGDPNRLAALGNLQTELRMDEEAADSYRQALGLAPRRADIHYNLGLLLRRGEDFAAAVVEFRAAAADLPGAWNDVGLCEKALGNLDEAEKAFRLGIVADPGSWMAAFNLGKSYVEWGRPDAAREALLVARQRAAAAGAPVGHIETILNRLGP